MTTVVPRSRRSQLLFQMAPATAPVLFITLHKDVELVTSTVDVEIVDETYDVTCDAQSIWATAASPVIEVDVSRLYDVRSFIDIICMTQSSEGPVDKFIIKRHDHRPVIRIRVIQDNAPLDLTGVTARFAMQSADGALKVNAPASVQTPPNAGIAFYTWQGTDTDTAGNYRAEFELDFGDGSKLTVPNNNYINIEIIEDLNNT